MSHSPVAHARLQTGGGWRRTCVRRERRWPSFIIWRWAGPALDGWIRCRWRAPPLVLPPRLRRHSAILRSPRPAVLPRPPGLGAGPARRRPRGQAGSQPERAPSRLANPQREQRLPRKVAGAPHERVPAKPRRAASPPAARARAAQLRRSGLRRDGDGSPLPTPGSPV